MSLVKDTLVHISFKILRQVDAKNNFQLWPLESTFIVFPSLVIIEVMGHISWSWPLLMH